MMQAERWKRAIWMIFALTLFFVASFEKVWGLFIELPGVKSFFIVHADIEVWIRWGLWFASFLWSLLQAWRFVGAKNGKETSATLFGDCGVKQIPIEIGKSRKVNYIQPHKYADVDTARCRVVGRLSRWKKKSSDVVVLYGSRSCGRRETVCRAIPDKLYPLYRITYENKSSSFNDVVSVIMRFAKGTHCRHPTFLINCVHLLAPDEMKEMHKNGEKLCAVLAAEKKTARLVFLCTCNETLFDSSADWAFQFEPLNAEESDKFLQEASAALATKKEGSDAYALAKNLYAGRHLEAAENFARGNPADMFRFLEKISSRHEFLDPLDAVQAEWQKRWRHLNDKNESGKEWADKDEPFQEQIFAVLHLLVAFYREGAKEVPLSDFLRRIFGIKRTSPEEAKVKKALREILGLRNVSLSPFSLQDVSVPDFFCDEFLFSCGEFDKITFHDEWQRVVGSLFTDSELKSLDYAETYCSAMVNATIRCQLTNALPFERHPLQLYRFIDEAILRVVFSESQDRRIRNAAETRRTQICAMLRGRCAEAVAEFLADRLEVLETAEVFGIVAEDIEGYAHNAGEWIERALSLVLFLSEIEPDPMCWPPVVLAGGERFGNSNFLEAIRDKIETFVDTSGVTVRDKDNAWVLCWMLQRLLNNVGARPYSFTSESSWNAFFDKVMASLEKNRSKKLLRAADMIAAFFNGDAHADIGSLTDQLTRSFGAQWNIAHTFYFFLESLGRIMGQAENCEASLAAFISSTRRSAGNGKNIQMPFAVNRLLMKMEFAGAWQDAVGTIPENPTPAEVESLFPMLRAEMDKTCAKLGMDAENTPAFLVNVVAAVVGLQARFQDNQSYQESFLRSWGQLNAAIHERFYTFTERDWFNFMNVVQGQTQFLSSEIRSKYIVLWKAALEKIRASELGMIQIGSSELVMFLTTSCRVYSDKEWAKTTQGPLIELSMKSTFPFALKDPWKVSWMQCVYGQVVCMDPKTIFSMMFRVAGAECMAAVDCNAWDFSGISQAIQRGLADSVAFALQNAQTNVPCTVKSLPETRRNGYFSLWIETAKTVLLPYLTYLRTIDGNTLESEVLSFLFNFFHFLGEVAKKFVVNSDEILLAVKEVEDILLNRAEELQAEIEDFSNKVLQWSVGTSRDDAQIVLKAIERCKVMPQGTLFAMKVAAQAMPSVLEGIDESFDDDRKQGRCDDLVKNFECWYHKIRELYLGLTEEALERGGQNWYDDLMQAFAKCRAFGELNPELSEDAKKYVLAQQAIS